MTFGIVFLAFLVPLVLGAVATQVDEEIAMRSGFHKIHH